MEKSIGGTKGRVLDAREEPSVDVVSKGLEQLLHGTPLVEYNQAFKQLQRRRRIQPIVGESEYYDKLRHATSSIDTEVLLDADLEFIPQFSVDEEDEPMLQLLTAEDVSLDMDLVEIMDHTE
ncbi:hypothetical protein BDP27DRAFT_1457432 [Rhodocollybia butyracea]|uniref:Uncharacterized protein n=1 Tax=Rhodocollybia butyracea TaxID=206335 RepID=A0A9P5P5N8_9AGAR|nr:hypothetical protein BDP27DRAFT_1457432 [Rhodocollybia butyracea]